VAVESLPASRVSALLNGSWTVTGSSGTQTVTVPTTIPFTADITRWTRTFPLNLSAPPRVAYLEFEGIVHTAVVRLNGIEVGRLVAMTHSRVDILPALNFNGMNTLELEIDDRLTTYTVPGGPTHWYVPTLGPISYTLPVAWAHRPGIIRNVWLVISDRAVITGIFAEQNFNADLSQVDMRVRVRVVGENPTNLLAGVVVTQQATSAGSCLAQATAPDELSCTITVSSPALWSPASPVLHHLWVTLYDGGGMADGNIDRIGFRKIERRGNLLYLNNQRLFLRGISRHDIYGNRDFVADDATIDQDLTRLKALNVNFVRSIHYPPDARLTRRADELGLLVSQEIPGWAAFVEEEVTPIALQMVRSMIERDFNRPSVILWFVGSGDPAVAEQSGYLGQAVALAKSVDPSRPVSFVIDNASYQPAEIVADANIMRNAGADFYTKNAYWTSNVIDQLMLSMPADMPVLIGEWSGSEGSDRGPIGAPGTRAFPDNDYPWGGYYPESFQAFTMLPFFVGWYPYVGCTSPGSACVSGLVYFTWQDIEWPAMGFFYPGHYPMLRNGLVYEDRVEKAQPISIFHYLMQLLP
jgi:beta-galactosidase/beta-glucuronidase